MDIILYLLQTIQYLYQQNCWLIIFICKYIPLKQWTHDDSHSPKYQKFKIDELPRIHSFKQDWDWNDLISYYKLRYGKEIKPMFRRVECDIPKDCTCPACNAPVLFLGMMVRKSRRFVVKSVRLISPQRKITAFLKQPSFDALTARISLFLKRIVSTSLYINV